MRTSASTQVVAGSTKLTPLASWCLTIWSRMATAASESVWRSWTRIRSTSSVEVTRTTPTGCRGSSADASAGPSPTRASATSSLDMSTASPPSPARSRRAMVKGESSGAPPSASTLTPGDVSAARSDTTSFSSATGTASAGTSRADGSGIGISARWRSVMRSGRGEVSASARSTCQMMGRPASGCR